MLVCGSHWQYGVVCVVFVVLLVASVLASMHWLLCGGDSSKEKTTSVISKKSVPRENLSPLRFKLVRKNKPASNYELYRFNKFEKRSNLHHAFL